MANWDYVLKFIICGDAAVGKSSLLVRLTDQRFLANPDPTVSPHDLSSQTHTQCQNTLSREYLGV